MATEPKPLISDELLHQVQEAAQAQNREPGELVAEAVRKYLDEQSWVRFVRDNERQARVKGINEEDVERLIAETRHENAERGR